MKATNPLPLRQARNTKGIESVPKGLWRNVILRKRSFQEKER